MSHKLNPRMAEKTKPYFGAEKKTLKSKMAKQDEAFALDWHHLSSFILKLHIHSINEGKRSKGKLLRKTFLNIQNR